MNGISGFFNLNKPYLSEKTYCENILKDMHQALLHRNPQPFQPWIKEHIAGNHPYIYKGRTNYAIFFDGSIYNRKELFQELSSLSYKFETNSDSELILYCYLSYGPNFVTKLNGVFSIVIWDEALSKLFLYRDRIGAKPLYYSLQNNNFVFASEIKALFCHPDIHVSIDNHSFQELLGLGPAHTSGTGIFKDIYELRPGHFLTFSKHNLLDFEYWDLKSLPHTDDYATTVDTVSFLVKDSIHRQLQCDQPLCSFLSGGLDSSIVTALSANELSEKGEILNTYSFDFTDNDKFFESNSFQPERDFPYINTMLEHYKTNHSYLECDPNTLFSTLFQAVAARDLPGMTDIDGSLLYFCSQVAQKNKIALTGECADEIFGGYPWFYRPELLNAKGFPWSSNLETRSFLLEDDFVKQLDLNEYVNHAYKSAIAQAPSYYGDNKDAAKRQQVGYLCIKWFMQTLLDRMDRSSSYSGLEARVPFADHRIMEYVFNVPWEMKYQNNVEKHLLRKACEGLLPKQLLQRKKSPYPKTYHPGYEKLLKEELNSILHNPNAPIYPILKKDKVKEFMNAPKELGKPWYGQLMAGPQLMAYYIQLNDWMEKFHLTVL